jgi:hypothetical protein
MLSSGSAGDPAGVQGYFGVGVVSWFQSQRFYVQRCFGKGSCVSGSAVYARWLRVAAPAPTAAVVVSSGIVVV